MLPWNVEDLTLDEDRFAGVVRIFPLPDLVLFPHVMQPLHIFEQRYRDLLNDALDGDGLIAMAALAPGWEKDYEGRPPVHSQACLGKVVAHHRLDDGRYNLMLLGARRIRIVEESTASRSFRLGTAEILHDHYPTAGDARRRELRDRLARQFTEALPSKIPPNEQAGAVSAGDLPLEVLTDLAAFVLPLKRELKLQLLAECNVDRRAAMLLRVLRSRKSSDLADADPADAFPPPFSAN